jgi:sugar phosphate isomerase/epimerase
MLTTDDTVFCTGTTRGVDFATKARTARAAGFTAISMRPAEYDAMLTEGFTPDGVRSFLADLGMRIAELDPVMTWLPGAEAPARMHAVDEVLTIAQVVDPDCVSVLVPVGAALDLGAATEAFAALCDRAHDAGVRMAIEFFAWSPLDTLLDTWTIVRDAERPNGGMILDTWHHARRGGTVADLRLVDLSRVWGVQIADAPRLPVVDDLAAECRDHRRWPGTGDLPLVEIVRALRHGGCDAALGIEVFGDATDEASARDRARLAYASLAPFTAW